MVAVTITISKFSLVAFMLVILIVLIGVNQYLISSISSGLARAPVTGATVAPTQTRTQAPQTTTPQATEYGISFSEDGFNTLVGYSRLDLTSEQKERFIRIGTQERTACEACCGIGKGPAIDSNGNPRCGCGHNLALIGLMKYLVKNYGDKYTDQQILDEVMKWKVFFFPQLAGGSPAQRGGC